MNVGTIPSPLRTDGPAGQGLCLERSKEVRRTVPSRIERITRIVDKSNEGKK